MTTEKQGPQWTKEQLQAIEVTGANLLVAAAAGSGKTAVLVERIIQRLMDTKRPISLENMLVVTFTEAAAGEMRQRIGAALEKAVTRQPENKALRRQLLLLNRAHISTIHSFCLWVLRTYFYRINLDPGFRVIDPAEAELLQLEVIDQVLEECFSNEPDGGPITDLADSLGGRGDANLADLVLDVWKFSRGLPWPEAWLDQAASFYKVNPGDTLRNLSWYSELIKTIKLFLQEVDFYLKQAMALSVRPGGPAKYLDNLEDERFQVKKLLQEIDKLDWEQLCQRLVAIDFKRLSAIRGEDVDKELKEKVTKLREQAKEKVKQLKEYFCRDEATVWAELKRAGEFVTALIEVVKTFDYTFTELKRRRGMVDFNDLEHLCLQVLLDENTSPGELKPSVVALELRKKFDEVLVDEYQDINSVQDAILTLVSRQDTDNPNFFMVGDVKQSIYRFRMANPSIFLSKYHQYPEGSKLNRLILLSNNFRSRQGIIDAVNFIFIQIFSSLVGEITYDDKAMLKGMAHYPEDSHSVTRDVEVYLQEKQTPEEEQEDGFISDSTEIQELTFLEREALLVARRIQRMVNGTKKVPGPEFKVWDAARKEYRSVTYRDIVILLRSIKDKAQVFVDTLNQLGIPAYAELGSGYFDSIEVETMLSLLRVIDNPYQDIPLAAVLRSPLVGLTAEELAHIRLAAPKKDFFTALKKAAKEERKDEKLTSCLRDFLDRLEKWRTLARRQPLGDVIWQLYRDTGYLEFVGGLPGGVQRQANLRALLDRARQFEKFSRHGLFRFLRFIERLQKNDGDLGAAHALGENENVVRVMSIHKSKGLEFPVVFIADLGKEFNIQDLSKDVLLHGKYGLMPLYFNPTIGLKYPTLPYLAIAHRLRLEALSEEVRVLYVALTRAREKLILVGSVRDLPSQAEKWCAGLFWHEKQLAPIQMAQAKKALDWIMPALARHPQGEVLRNLAEIDGGFIIDDSSTWQIKTLDEKDISSMDCDFDEEENLVENKEDFVLSDDALYNKDKLFKEIDKRLSWVYPRQALVSLPVKLAVTDLKRRYEDYSEGQPLMVANHSSFNRRPLFLQEKGLTAAERGVATHLVLQHIDLRKPITQDSVKKLLDRMIEQEFIKQEQAAAVDIEAIIKFFNTPLGKRLLINPAKVRRELSFSLAVPVKELYPDIPQNTAAGEITLVQGIIDCLIQEGNSFLLLDFKTGKVPNNPLDVYQEQISFYCRAVESIFSFPVKEAYLYFIDKGIDIRVI